MHNLLTVAIPAINSDTPLVRRTHGRVTTSLDTIRTLPQSFSGATKFETS